LGHRTCAGPKPETRHFSICHRASRLSGDTYPACSAQLL